MVQYGWNCRRQKKNIGNLPLIIFGLTNHPPPQKKKESWISYFCVFFSKICFKVPKNNGSLTQCFFWKALEWNGPPHGQVKKTLEAVEPTRIPGFVEIDAEACTCGSKRKKKKSMAAAANHHLVQIISNRDRKPRAISDFPPKASFFLEGKFLEALFQKNSYRLVKFCSIWPDQNRIRMSP